MYTSKILLETGDPNRHPLVFMNGEERWEDLLFQDEEAIPVSGSGSESGSIAGYEYVTNYNLNDTEEDVEMQDDDELHASQQLESSLSLDFVRSQS